MWHIPAVFHDTACVSESGHMLPSRSRTVFTPCASKSYEFEQMVYLRGVMVVSCSKRNRCEAGVRGRERDVYKPSERRLSKRTVGRS